MGTTNRVTRRVPVAFLALLILSGCAALRSERPSEPRPSSARKLIHFGWNTPDVPSLRERVSEFERIPFDGLVLMPTVQGGSRPVALRYAVFRTARLSSDAIDTLVADLRAIPFRRFTDNFLLVQVVPGDVDWFDDWSPIHHNAGLVARAAREGGLKGIMLDIEQYQFHVFQYTVQPQRERRSFEAYAEQARRRGREFIAAINAAFPDPVVFLTRAYTIADREIQAWEDLPQASYALLPAFLDGMLEGASPGTVLVDGFEEAYGFYREFEFAQAAFLVRQWLSRRSAVPDRYRAHMRVAFGLWLDYGWRDPMYPWTAANPEGNYVTPARFRTALRFAMKYSDEYVWVYTEQANWWTGEKLHPEYVRALGEAR